MNTRKNTRTEAPERVYKELKITFAFTAAEWIDIQRYYENMRAFRQGTACPTLHKAPYTWADFADDARDQLVNSARCYNRRTIVRKELERARAAGFSIPDSAVSGL